MISHVSSTQNMSAVRECKQRQRFLFLFSPYCFVIFVSFVVTVYATVQIKYKWNGIKFVAHPVCKICHYNIIIIIIIILLFFILLTSIVLSPVFTGYFTCTQIWDKYIGNLCWEGLYKKHVVATLKLGNHLSIRL